MALDPTAIMTFGDLRRSIINDINAIRNGDMNVATGTVVASMYKELTSTIQVEINAAKLALATEDKAHTFGKVVGMGKRLIANGEGQESS